MYFNITAKQIAHFILTALLLQIAVYFITGLVCWYRFSFSLYQFSLLLSWAGLVILAISGILFTSAKPKTWRPEEDTESDKSSKGNKRSFGHTIVSQLKPLIGLSAMTPVNDSEDNKKTPRKLTSKQLYYYSGLAFSVGVMTLISSEVIYRTGVSP